MKEIKKIDGTEEMHVTCSDMDAIYSKLNPESPHKHGRTLSYFTFGKIGILIPQTCSEGHVRSSNSRSANLVF